MKEKIKCFFTKKNCDIIGCCFWVFVITWGICYFIYGTNSNNNGLQATYNNLDNKYYEDEGHIKDYIENNKLDLDGYVNFVSEKTLRDNYTDFTNKCENSIDEAVDEYKTMYEDLLCKYENKCLGGSVKIR